MQFLKALEKAAQQPNARKALKGKEQADLNAFLNPCSKICRRKHRRAVRKVEKELRRQYAEEQGGSWFDHLLISATKFIAWMADNMSNIVTIIRTLAPFIILI